MSNPCKNFVLSFIYLHLLTVIVCLVVHVTILQYRLAISRHLFNEDTDSNGRSFAAMQALRRTLNALFRFDFCSYDFISLLNKRENQNSLSRISLRSKPVSPWFAGPPYVFVKVSTFRFG